MTLCADTPALYCGYNKATYNFSQAPWHIKLCLIRHMWTWLMTVL